MTRIRRGSQEEPWGLLWSCTLIDLKICHGRGFRRIQGRVLVLVVMGEGREIDNPKP